MKDKIYGALKSWTVHFNVWIGIIAAVLPVAQEQLPQLQAVIPANIYAVLFNVVLIGNVLLRFRTSLPLEHK